MSKSIGGVVNVGDTVDIGLCSFCGACIAVCPSKNLYSIKWGPSNPLVGDSKYCSSCRWDLCRIVCPQIDIPSELYDRSTYGYLEAYEARSTIPSVLKRAQDGGIVSTLLITALENKLVDAVLAVKHDRKWNPEPVVIRDPGGVIECSGSIYLYAPTLALLKDIALDNSIEKALVVGLPCQIRALEKMRRASLNKYVDKIEYTIGLFCTHNFTREELYDILSQLDIYIDDVERMYIEKGELRFKLESGVEKGYPLEKTFETLRCSCRQCPEFISAYADISVGSIGSPSGWNTVVIRSSRGASLFKLAVEQGFIEARPLSEKGGKIVRKFIRRKVKGAVKHRESLVSTYNGVVEGKYGLLKQFIDEKRDFINREGLAIEPIVYMEFDRVALEVRVDPVKCIECRACEIACMSEHKSLVPGIRVVEAYGPLPLPLLCMHCREPACMMVCPVGAVYRDRGGAIRIMEDKCIGCLLCMMACPFNLPLPFMGKAVKCDLCVDRRESGRLPACVEACPTNALVITRSKTSVEKTVSEKHVVRESVS